MEMAPSIATFLPSCGEPAAEHDVKSFQFSMCRPMHAGQFEDINNRIDILQRMA